MAQPPCPWRAGGGETKIPREASPMVIMKLSKNRFLRDFPAGRGGAVSPVTCGKYGRPPEKDLS